MRASVGQGRYVASEWDVNAGSIKVWANPSLLPGVLVFHGAGGTAFNSMDSSTAGQLQIFQRLSEVYPTVSADWGGASNWGNDTAISRVTSGQTYIQGSTASCRAKSGKVMLVGLSMGFTTACNWARANLSQVACIVGIIPANDVNDMVTNNRGGTAAGINAAYGGTYSESTDGPTHNPTNYAASLNVPIKLWYSDSDTVVVPSTVTNFVAHAPNASAVDVGSQGHSEATMLSVNMNDVLSFIAASL